MRYRIENDSLGEVKIRSDLYYGAYTQRVIGNYGLRGSGVPTDFIKTYLRLKRAYALANYSAGKLDIAIRDAILSSVDAILQEKDDFYADNFPIIRVQSGGGTSTNMNVNEVIANYALVHSLNMAPGEYAGCHPNDHVNMSQSSNDTFPSVTKILTYELLGKLIKGIEACVSELTVFRDKYGDIKKVGRTHLQDAVTITVGDEVGAFVSTLRKNLEEFKGLTVTMSVLPAGGTATGSLQNISPGLRDTITSELSQEFGAQFNRPDSFFEAVSSSHDLNKLASSLKVFSIDLIKMLNDLRLLASGPTAGLGEYHLAPIQPGSSIMPGKINPSAVEAVEMVAMGTVGRSETVALATSNAQLQLQQFNPVIAWSLYDSLTDLNLAMSIFNSKVIRSLSIDKPRIEELLDESLVEATDLSEVYGYDTVAKAVKISLKEGLPLKDALDRV